MKKPFDEGINLAEMAVKINPSLRFYVPRPEGGYILVTSEGNTGPHDAIPSSPGEGTYILEVTYPNDRGLPTRLEEAKTQA